MDAGRVIGDIIFRDGLNHRIQGADLGLSDGGAISFTAASSTGVASTAVNFDSNLILHPANATSDGSHTFHWQTVGTRTIAYNGDISAGETSGTVTLNITSGGLGVTNFNGNLLDHATNGTLRVEANASGRPVNFNGTGSTFSGGLLVNNSTIGLGADEALGTGTVTWNSGVLGNSSYSNRVLSNDFVVNDTLQFNRFSGHTFKGDFILNNSSGSYVHLIGDATGRTQTIENVVDGGFGNAIRFTGVSHSLRLPNANPDWTGGLIFEGRQLTVENSNALGSGTLVWNGGVYEGPLSQPLTIPNAMEWNGFFLPFSETDAAQTFTGNIILGSDAGLDPFFGRPQVTGTNTTSNLFTFSGVISDGGHDKALSLGGSNTSLSIALTGNNTFTGGVIVTDLSSASMTLRVGHDNSLGSGTLVVLRDTFTLSQTGAETSLNLPNAIEIDASFTLGSYAGWEFSGPVALSTVDNETVGIEFGGGAANVAVFSGVVTDANDVTFVKTGTGTLAFSNNSNAIDGTIQVDGGGIQVGAGGATGQLGGAAVELAGGTSLIFNRSDAFTFANEVSGAGGLIARGGDAELTGALTFTGNSTVEDGGTLRISSTYDEGSTFNVLSGGTFGGAGTIGDTESPTIGLAAGAFFSPGAAATAGTLTLGVGTTLDLTNIEGTGTGALIFRLGSVSDLVDGGFIFWTQDLLGFDDFGFVAQSGFGQGTYILFDNISTAFGASLDDDNLTGMVGGLESTLSLDGSTLSLTVIPEPGTVAAILGALALGLVGWRRRQSRQV